MKYFQSMLVTIAVSMTCTGYAHASVIFSHEKDFISRDKNQIPENEKEKRADFIFSNNGSKDDLYKKAELLLLTLNAG